MKIRIRSLPFKLPYIYGMNDDFFIPVTCNDKEYLFPARLLRYGYSFKIEVDIQEMKVLFEPDEERNWRALISYEDIHVNQKVNGELLKAVAEVIEKILK